MRIIGLIAFTNLDQSGPIRDKSGQKEPQDKYSEYHIWYGLIALTIVVNNFRVSLEKFGFQWEKFCK